MANNYETLDELLKKKRDQGKVGEKPKKKKGLIVAIVAVVAAAAIGVTSIVASLLKKGNNGAKEEQSTTISDIGLDDLGNELTTDSTTKTTYKVVSGDIDPDKIVEQDGKLYVDEDSASKAKQTKTSIDLKNDTLKTSVVKDKDGKTTVKVYDKTTGYVIEDKTNKTTVTGNLKDDGIPDGYAYDPVLKKIVKEEEVGKYVYADATYYDKDGNVALQKGDVVLKETLEKAKKYFSTTTTKKTTTTTTTKGSTTNGTTTANKGTTTTTSKQTTTSNQGKLNADGTYTIYGMTFETKEDYQQWVLDGYTGYAEIDGIMKPEEEIINQLTK